MRSLGNTRQTTCNAVTYVTKIRAPSGTRTLFPPAILRDPTVREPLVEGGHTVVGSSPAEFAAVIQRDLRVWSDLARQLGVKVD